MLALALVLPACVLITQTDVDDHDALVVGDDSAWQDSAADDTAADDTGADDTGADDTAPDDTGPDDTASVSAWQGERVLYVEDAAQGPLCELHWAAAGGLSELECADCEWAYDLDFDYEGDLLGQCDGEYWWPTYTLGLVLDYEDDQDWMVLYYNDMRYTAGQVDRLGDGYVSYYSVWYSTVAGYYFTYIWQGTASYE